jgi:hypothetical protein
MTGRPQGPSEILGPDYLAPDVNPFATFLRLAAYLSYMQADAAKRTLAVRSANNERS